MAKKNGKQEKQATLKVKTITLGIDDRRWYENLLMKETLIKKNAEDGLRQVAAEAEGMMRQLSEREGVDLRTYNINWQTGEAVPKEQPA